MFNAGPPVYAHGMHADTHTAMQAGVQGNGTQQNVFSQPSMNQSMLSMFGTAPVQLSPQAMTPYGAAGYGYGGALPTTTSPPPAQAGYYNAQPGAPAFFLHNASMGPSQGVFVTNGNGSYLPVSYNAPQGTLSMAQLSAPVPQAHAVPDTALGVHGRGVAGAGGTWTGAASPPGAGAAGGYEVHDTHLKTPIPVNQAVVVPTTGSERLFHPRGKDSDAQRSRTMLRVCELFVEGNCPSGDRCGDVHVYPDYVQAMRQQLSSWLVNREREFNSIRTTTPDKTFRVFVADLKEVVDIPVSSLTFTKGLYVDPATRARRTRGVTSQGRGSVATAQVPTGCGLYSTDPANCKWGRWCNQVHIAKAWMSARKQEFDQWFTKLEDHYLEMPAEQSFLVHDPQSKTTLDIPKYAISGFTRGLFQGSERKAPSVCLLFQRGRCTAAACCNQIHVDHTYLDLARQKMSHTNDQGQGNQSTPSPALADITQRMEALRQALLAKEAQEVRRLTEEAAQRHAQTAKANAAASAAKTTNAAHDSPGQVLSESPNEHGLIEHIAVDDDDEDTAPLKLQPPTRGVGAVAVRHPNGSYTNNPYGSVTSIADEHSASSSLLSLGGLVIGPGAGRTSITSGGNGVAVTVQQRSSNSFSRTPAASVTGHSSGAKRNSYSKSRPTHSYFGPQADASSLFFNGSNNSYSNPAGAGNGTTNQAPNQPAVTGYGDGYCSGSFTHPLSTEDGSLHFSITQFTGVNGSTVSVPKSADIPLESVDNGEVIA